MTRAIGLAMTHSTVVSRIAIVSCAGALATSLDVAPAFAGGLYLQEFATPSMSVAGAGAQAVAVDASTAFHNPAGMPRLEGHQLMAGAGVLIADTEFDADSDTPIPGNDGGEAGGLGPILSLMYAHKITDDLSAGFSLVSISGAVLDYNNDWAGRFQNQEVSLLTVNATPTVAYRFNDHVSVGAGPTFMYATLDQDAAAPRPGGDEGRIKIKDADDLEVGWVAGGLLEITESTRIGISYQSKIDTNLNGKIEREPADAEGDVNLNLPFPQTLRIGAYHDLNDRWAVLGSVRWEDWSTLKDIPITTEQGGGAIKRNWRDTYGFSLGVHYKPADRWLLQAGFGYDTSPVSDKNRTADMPIDRQLRFAAGARYQLTENFSIGGSAVFADYGDAKIDNGQTLKGKYTENRIIFFALNANYTFDTPTQ